MGVNWYLRVDNGDMKNTFVPKGDLLYDIVLFINDLAFLSALITLVIALMTFVWNEVEGAQTGILVAAVISGVVWSYLLLHDEDFLSR